MSPPASQIHELFPTPVMVSERAIELAQVAALVQRFGSQARVSNPRSDALAHTRILPPDADPLLDDLARRLMPLIVEFGEQLFGERLAWRIKEMWVNTLHKGGRQSVHNHANCFISGVLYLSDCHPSARLTFIKALGGRDFVFSNTHAGSRLGPFNADRWMAPQASPGDLLLFPSYLLHEVPTNQGGTRISLAFNAIPSRLDSWGYRIGLTP